MKLSFEHVLDSTAVIHSNTVSPTTMNTIQISDTVLFSLGLIIGMLGTGAAFLARQNKDLESKVDDLQWRVNRNNRDSK